MIVFHADRFVPGTLRTPFLIFRTVVGIITMATIAYLSYALLFPKERFAYSYGKDRPSETVRLLDIPHGTDEDRSENGHLHAGETIAVYAGTLGDVSSAEIVVTLTDTDDAPDTLSLLVRRSFRSFFFPEGEPLRDIRDERVLAIDNKPYLLVDETISPFASDRAALSWTATEDVLPAKSDAFDVFSSGKIPVGFRPGSIISDGRDIFAVDGSGTLRPFRDDTVFDALGFRTDDIIPASETELRVHPRGDTIDQSEPQPEGTVFLDDTTGRHCVVEEGTCRPLGSDQHGDMLLRLVRPIEATGKAFDTAVSCSPERNPVMRHSYRCHIPLTGLGNLPGRSYELSLSAGKDIRIDRLSVSFSRTPNRRNVSLFLKDVKRAFLDAYAGEE